MKMIGRRSVIGLAGFLALSTMAGVADAADAAFVSVARQPAQQEEFVPIDELPPEDQLPAAPLLVAAYAVAWVAVFGYLWSIWRRLDRVERELAEVARQAANR